MELDLAMRTTGAVRSFTDAPVDDATLVPGARSRAVRAERRQPAAVAGHRREGSGASAAQLRDLSQLGWREYCAFVEARRGAVRARRRRPAEPVGPRSRRGPGHAPAVRLRRRPRPGAGVARDRRAPAEPRGARRRIRAPEHRRRRLDLPVRPEPPAVGAKRRARRRHDDVPRPPGGRGPRAARLPAGDRASRRSSRSAYWRSSRASSSVARSRSSRSSTGWTARRSMAERATPKPSVGRRIAALLALADVRRGRSSRSWCCSSATSPRCSARGR